MLDLPISAPNVVEPSVFRSPRHRNPRNAGAPVETLIAAGVRVPLDRRIVTQPIETALRSGDYEADETRSLPDVVRVGDRVLELGAGMGFVSTILAKRTKAAKIVAMEANPQLIPFIRRVSRC
jgi:predicted methyltransferase